jgi:NADH dehydrogenase/NADH:ubiquinone oxidoreductase subunit G
MGYYGTMKANTKVNWHNTNDYNLGCDIKELEKLGFVNSSYHNDLAPSYELENKLKIFFIDTSTDEMKAESQNCKFVINKINQDDELKHIYSTNNFDEVLKLVKFSK